MPLSAFPALFFLYAPTLPLSISPAPLLYALELFFSLRPCDPGPSQTKRAASPPTKKEPSKGSFFIDRLSNLTSDYLMIFVTTPAPTVRPPSRIAKRKPSSIAIGAINSTLILMLSPGITILISSGKCTVPVTSVVRK